MRVSRPLAKLSSRLEADSRLMGADLFEDSSSRSLSIPRIEIARLML